MQTNSNTKNDTNDNHTSQTQIYLYEYIYVCMYDVFIEDFENTILSLIRKDVIMSVQMYSTVSPTIITQNVGHLDAKNARCRICNYIRT